MVRKFSVVVICLALLCGTAIAQDAKTVIADAQKALGDVKSITYSGSGKDVSFQQCGANSTDQICKGTHNPMRPINNYVRVIDLTAPLSRATGATMNVLGGGGGTAIGPGNFSQQIAAQATDVGTWTGALGGNVEFYITPWGFLKGAAANNATASKQKGYTVLTWHPTAKAPSGKEYTINGYVNGKNIVERVETWLPDNMMGDMQVLAVYSGWKDFGGVMAPTKIVQTRGGFPYFEVDVTAAKANPTDLATLGLPPAPAAGAGGRGGGGAAPAGAPPAGGAAAGGRGGAGAPAGAPAAGGRGGQGGAGAIPPAPGGAPVAAGGRGGGAPAAGAPAAGGAGGRGGGAPAPLVVTNEKLGDGVYRLTTGGGSYDSVIVEFKDYVMMLEAGQAGAPAPAARGVAYIAETKKLIPNKPIRYVFVTHPHSDHTGGLPALVAEGATILTSKNNEEFFEKSLNTPRTLLDPALDPLAKNPKPAKVEGMGEKKVFSDSMARVEFYHVPGAPHSNGLMIAYLPKEKVLFQGDFSLPTNPGEVANDHVKALGPVLEKLNLDYTRYINVHASAAPQTKADVLKAVEDRKKADAAAK